MFMNNFRVLLTIKTFPLKILLFVLIICYLELTVIIRSLIKTEKRLGGGGAERITVD